MVSSTVRRTLRARLLAVAAALLTALSAGLLATSQPASAASYATITGAGSTWAQNAINTWTQDVAANGLQVNYAGVGSQDGLQDFAAGVVNFAASDVPYGVPGGGTAYLPPSRGYAYMPDTAGGVAFMYNLTIGGQRVTNLRLSGAVIAGIFTNQITMWNDPRIAADNPGITLPAIAVIPVVPADSSGATWAFTQWMAATQGSSWTAYCQAAGLSPCTATSVYPVQSGTAMVGQPGDLGIVNYVAQPQTNGAIGMTEYAYAIEAGFPVAKVLNAAGYYTAPTPGNVGLSLLNAQVNTDGTADLSQVYTDTDPRTYELSYYSYMIVPTSSTAQDPLTANQGYSLGTFGQFALCRGQQQVDSLGYAALPVNLVEDGYAQLAKIPGAQVPPTVSSFIEGCDNPTFSPDGTDLLATTNPMPLACDQQGTTQCAASSGLTETNSFLGVSPNPAAAGQLVTFSDEVVGYPDFPTPVGSVQFAITSPTLPGGVSLTTNLGAPVPVSAEGTAGLTEALFLPPGTYGVSATFTPTDDTAFEPSTDTASLTVNASPDQSGTEQLQVTVPPAGAFTFTAPGNATVAMTTSGDTATGAIAEVAVSDTRNTYPGWSVTGQVTDFTNPTSQPAGDIPGNQLGWAPNGSLSDDATLGNVVYPAAPGLGTEAAVLAYANAGTGFGTSTLGAYLTLAIPPTAPSGSYTGVLTRTADPAGP